MGQVIDFTKKAVEAREEKASEAKLAEGDLIEHHSACVSYMTTTAHEYLVNVLKQMKVTGEGAAEAKIPMTISNEDGVEWYAWVNLSIVFESCELVAPVEEQE